MTADEYESGAGGSWHARTRFGATLVVGGGETTPARGTVDEQSVSLTSYHD